MSFEKTQMKKFVEDFHGRIDSNLERFILSPSISSWSNFFSTDSFGKIQVFISHTSSNSN